MAPAHMTQRLFDALLSVLSNDDRCVLKNLYQLDENPFEPVYVLRPVNPAEKKAWRASEQQLQTILRQASDLCLQAKTISEDDRNKFHISGMSMNPIEFDLMFFVQLLPMKSIVHCQIIKIVRNEWSLSSEKLKISINLNENSKRNSLMKLIK